MLKRNAIRWAAALAGSSLLLVVAFATRPGVAQAATAPQVSVGQSANLAANIFASIPVTITCAPRTPDTSISASVNLEEAVSGRIAYGSETFANNINFGTGKSFPSPVACDNAAHKFAAGILANTAGVPFSEGQAIVTVSVQVCTLDGFQQTDCATTSVGPRVINLVSQ